jgi:hypothetical protein
MNTLANSLVQLASTSTTIPDDFLNIYPDEVPEGVGNLAESGFGISPFVLISVALLVLGASVIKRVRRTA